MNVHYNYVCVCVCVGGGEGSERIWNKYEKGKGKESERHLSASVMNNPRHLYKGRRGRCVGLWKGHPPWHIPTEVVLYMTMYTVSFLYIQKNFFT